MVTVILIVIAVILLVSMIIYNYAFKVDDTGASATDDSVSKKEETKKKVVGGLGVSGTIFATLAVLGSIWDYSVVSKTVSTCLQSTPTS